MGYTTWFLPLQKKNSSTSSSSVVFAPCSRIDFCMVKKLILWSKNLVQYSSLNDSVFNRNVMCCFLYHIIHTLNTDFGGLALYFFSRKQTAFRCFLLPNQFVVHMFSMLSYTNCVFVNISW